ncbi:hypothetical protein [Rhodopila sp.]|uniref:hypothetical protein n=1 Tax=Rhodopila sp. TaxID=2480087 RepID=UPI003D1324B9
MIGGATAGLSLLALALSGTIAFELAHRDTRPVDAPAAPTHAPNAATRTQVTPSRTEIDRRLSEILARPVFSPDRRPVDSGTHSVAGLSRLTGIVVTGSRKIAIFAAPSGEQPIVVEEGSHINAFEVTSITSAGVTVVGPGGSAVMTPVFDPAPPNAPRLQVPLRQELPRALKK